RTQAEEVGRSPPANASIIVDPARLAPALALAATQARDPNDGGQRQQDNHGIGNEQAQFHPATPRPPLVKLASRAAKCFVLRRNVAWFRRPVPGRRTSRLGPGRVVGPLCGTQESCLARPAMT